MARDETTVGIEVLAATASPAYCRTRREDGVLGWVWCLSTYALRDGHTLPLGNAPTQIAEDEWVADDDVPETGPFAHYEEM